MDSQSPAHSDTISHLPECANLTISLHIKYFLSSGQELCGSESTSRTTVIARAQSSYWSQLSVTSHQSDLHRNTTLNKWLSYMITQPLFTLNLFKTMAKKIETYHQILYYCSNKLSPPMSSPKSYQKYFLSFSSSPSLSEQCDPNTLNGARQSGHLLQVGSEDGPEQSITADLE